MESLFQRMELLFQGWGSCSRFLCNEDTERIVCLSGCECMLDPKETQRILGATK